MLINLGNIVFGGKGNGGGTPAAYVVPDGMNFGYSTLIPFDDFDFSQRTNFNNCWNGCQTLKEFPLLNISKGTRFYMTWYNCRALTSFPQLDLSSGTDFQSTWMSCSNLTEFPMLDLSNGTFFGFAWYGCSKLTSFPQLDLSSGTDFSNTWGGCPALTTLGGFGAISADFDLSASTKLTAESIMNVINQAATVTGKTMKFGSTNLAKLTDEQKAVATSKGWTLA